MGLKSLAILFFCLHRNLQVFGNPLGCVLVPDSVTSFDTYTQWNGYDETARCGDNCTELTVYLPSDGVCVQCPGDMRALGVGALNCSVVSPTRCSLVQLSVWGMLRCVAVCFNVFQCSVHEVVSCATHLSQCGPGFAPLCSSLVAVCCTTLTCCNVWQFVAEWSPGCSLVQLTCCSVLQCVAVYCSVVPTWLSLVQLNCFIVMQCLAVSCSVLQCGALCCSVLQCLAVSKEWEDRYLCIC